MDNANVTNVEDEDANQLLLKGPIRFLLDERAEAFVVSALNEN